MEIHKLLKRQLDKVHASVEEKPESQEIWSDFLARVNKAYIEADQERYLHERAMEISSRELMALNEKFESAQHIANLGHWLYDVNHDYAVWSKELFTILHRNPSDKPLNYEGFIDLVHEEDRSEFTKLTQKAFNEPINFESEIRLRISPTDYRWFKVIGQCHNVEKQISGVVIDIHKDKEVEEEIKELNQRLLTTARRAGMAEVATTILHNIGNTLNSSNVSISLLLANYKKPYLQKLHKIAETLNDYAEKQANFLNNDPKISLIPKYLLALSNVILEESQDNRTEIDNIYKDLQHIKTIVAMQNPVSGLASMKENTDISKVINTALEMSLNLSTDKCIAITKSFESCPSVYIDKSKLLQILVNLIQNARDAVLLNTQNAIKEINIDFKKLKKNKIQIRVSDNGVGIAHEDLNRIFAFGFTTKENGHGFGLHSSGISAQEMGGSLLAKSEGIGKGAAFILTLPIVMDTDTKGIFNE